MIKWQKTSERKKTVQWLYLYVCVCILFMGFCLLVKARFNATCNHKKNDRNISQILAYQNYNRNVSNSGNPVHSIASVLAPAMIRSG